MKKYGAAGFGAFDDRSSPSGSLKATFIQQGRGAFAPGRHAGEDVSAPARLPGDGVIRRELRRSPTAQVRCCSCRLRRRSRWELKASCPRAHGRIGRRRPGDDAVGPDSGHQKALKRSGLKPVRYRCVPGQRRRRARSVAWLKDQRQRGKAQPQRRCHRARPPAGRIRCLAS